MNLTINKLFYHPVTRIIAGILFCMAALMTIKTFISGPVLSSAIHSDTAVHTIKNYISTSTLLLSYFFLFRWYEKRKLTELSIKQLPLEFIGGFLFGLSCLSIVIFILYLLGYYHAIAFTGFSFMLAPFSFLVTAAIFEEILFRLVVYRILEKWLGTYVALLLICIIFSVPHLFNNHISVLSIFTLLLFSCVIALMYTYTKRLWLPFAFHLGWNFAQPFYGSNLSGQEDMGSIIKSKFEGPQFYTGSLFGIEDSIFSIIILAILVIVFLYLCKKNGKIVRGTAIRQVHTGFIQIAPL